MHVQAESPGEQGNFGIPDSTDKYTGIPRDSRVTGIGTCRYRIWVYMESMGYTL